MAVDYETVMSYRFPRTEHTYGARDTILYALGLGFGSDPMDTDELGFVYEKGLKALPTMAAVLGLDRTHPRDLPEFQSLNWQTMLHGETRIELEAPIPVLGTVIGQSRVVDIVDKGEDKGAIMYRERRIIAADTGAPIATVRDASFFRSDGGFGAKRGPSPKVHQLPATPPDTKCDFETLRQAALIYRLSGDYNPVHIDPAYAAGAGFTRPVLHGFCTFGIAARAILKTCCGYDPSRIKAIQARFSAPVYPGETIRTEIWQADDVISYRARVIERDLIVLNNGKAEIMR